MRGRLLIAVIGVALVAGACGDSGTSSGQHSHGTVPGAPGHAPHADRKVTVVASDELRFDPETISVEQGETITFVIENEGETAHEFVLGDEAYQVAHEQHMSGSGGQSGGHAGMNMNTSGAVTIPPGKTKTVTWQFTDAVEVLYGCHLPGHYDGGMVGTIEVG